MAKLLTYEEKDTAIHRLLGFTKMFFFVMWSLISMLTYDTRVLIVMIIISLISYKFSHTDWRQVATVFKLLCFFLSINIIAVFVIAPYEGCNIYGTRTDLFHIAGVYYMTAEQLFYEINIILKYVTIVPAVLIFIVTTNPSEFAASLNKLGVSYNISYAIAIALRYIPDVQDDYTKIKHAQEARGIEMSAKAKLKDRILNISAIIFPLVFSSMERIDVVSNAMELRGFGKHKKRTWYTGKQLTKADYAVIIFTTILSIAAMVITYYDGNRFYNPFILP